MNIRNLLVTATLAALTSSAFAGWTTVYSENFAGLTKRTTGDSATPQGVYDSSTHWYVSAASTQSVGSLDGDAFRLRGNTAQTNYFQGYTSVAAPIDVANAATSGIKVNFDFVYNGTGTSVFRMGLLNSQADPLYSRAELSTTGVHSQGGSGTTAPNSSQPFMAWSGYYFGVAQSSATSATTGVLQKRLNSTAVITSSATEMTYMNGGTATAWSAGGSANGGLVNGTVYSAEYSISYNNANSLTLSSVITNRATSAIITQYSITTTSIDLTSWDGADNGLHTDGSSTRVAGGTKFDTIVFAAGTSPQITMDNLVISTIPEPATYAACLGALSLLVVGFRRFRR